MANDAFLIGGFVQIAPGLFDATWVTAYNPICTAVRSLGSFCAPSIVKSDVPTQRGNN
jgi:hypothetical protein